MNVFLTGATGFIGKLVMRRLLEDPRFVCIKYLTRGVIAAPFDGAHCFAIKGRLNDFERYSHALAEADIVFHLGAELDSKAEDIRDVNVESTRFIARAIESRGIPLVFLSSATVGKRMWETTYSETKKEAENAILESGCRHIIIRPTWVIGSDSPSYRNFLSYLKKFPVVPVVGDGLTQQSPLYIDDCVNFIMAASRQTGSHIYTISGPERVSYVNMIHHTLKVIGIKKKLLIRLPVWLCKLLAEFTPALSYDAMSDFLEESPVPNNDLSAFVKCPTNFHEATSIILDKLKNNLVGETR